MVYITGDTHGDFCDSRIDFIQKLKKSDKLIVLGDFGFNWNASIREFYSKIDHDCTILFLGGNHENYTYLESLPKTLKFGAIARVFGNNTYFLETGRMYHIEGKKWLIYGGALSIDMASREPFISWWPQEIPSNEEFKRALSTLKRNNYKFDYLLSHTSCTNITSQMRSTFSFKINDPVEQQLQNIEDLIKENNGDYLCNFFGHWHVNEIIDDKHICLYEKVINIKDDIKKVLKNA